MKRTGRRLRFPLRYGIRCVENPYQPGELRIETGIAETDGQVMWSWCGEIPTVVLIDLIGLINTLEESASQARRRRKATDTGTSTTRRAGGKS